MASCLQGGFDLPCSSKYVDYCEDLTKQYVHSNIAGHMQLHAVLTRKTPYIRSVAAYKDERSPNCNRLIFSLSVLLFSSYKILNMTETAITGNCLCGTVQYELSGPPIINVLCHCKNCKKSTGSSFMANSIFKKTVRPLSLPFLV